MDNSKETEWNEEKVNPVEQNIEENQLPEEIHEEHKDLVSRRTSSRIVWKSEDIMKVRKFFNCFFGAPHRFVHW